MVTMQLLKMREVTRLLLIFIVGKLKYIIRAKKKMKLKLEDCIGIRAI